MVIITVTANGDEIAENRDNTRPNDARKLAGSEMTRNLASDGRVYRNIYCICKINVFVCTEGYLCRASHVFKYYV